MDSAKKLTKGKNVFSIVNLGNVRAKGPVEVDVRLRSESGDDQVLKHLTKRINLKPGQSLRVSVPVTLPRTLANHSWWRMVTNVDSDMDHGSITSPTFNVIDSRGRLFISNFKKKMGAGGIETGTATFEGRSISYSYVSGIQIGSPDVPFVLSIGGGSKTMPKSLNGKSLWLLDSEAGSTHSGQFMGAWDGSFFNGVIYFAIR